MSEKLDKLSREAKDSKITFGRSMTCNMSPVDHGVLTVSRFTDRYHDIEMTLLINRGDFTIGDIHLKMDKVPYDVCREAIGCMDNLKGLVVFHPAVNREVRRRIKRKDGCTHLFELLEFTLGSLFGGGPTIGLNGGQVIESDRVLPPEEHRKLHATNPVLQNTCRAFIREEE